MWRMLSLTGVELDVLITAVACLAVYIELDAAKMSGYR